jgi:hypothetical protein
MLYELVRHHNALAKHHNYLTHRPTPASHSLGHPGLSCQWRCCMVRCCLKLVSAMVLLDTCKVLLIGTNCQ